MLEKKFNLRRYKLNFPQDPLLQYIHEISPLFFSAYLLGVFCCHISNIILDNRN